MKDKINLKLDSPYKVKVEVLEYHIRFISGSWQCISYYNKTMIYEWLDRIRKMGLRHSFCQGE